MEHNTIVNIGVQRFDRIREQKAFYIDKTAFIKEWWESGCDVTLITRPRRFGKTLNMSMLECFFPVSMQTEVICSRDFPFGRKNLWREITHIGSCKAHFL